MFSIGAKIQRRLTDKNFLNDYTPLVSVVVPARNEQDRIGRCIRSLLNSNYPEELFEIIIVNDRSNDKTKDIVLELSRGHSNIKLVNIAEDNTNKNLSGKSGALDAGINASGGEIILMTDADCAVSREWIRTMVKGFKNEKVGMIPSFTLVKYKNLFHKFQAIEWIFMETMASGGIGLKQPLGCFGNNIAIRKSHYEEFGGYANISFSVTEDLALMSAMHNSKKEIKFFCNYESTVKTLPCETFSDYISQHRRWTIGGQALGWRAAIFVLSSLAIWCGIIVAALLPSFELFITVVVTRVLGDFIVIAPSLIKLKEKNLFPWIFPAVIFLMVLELIVPFFLLNKKVEWKGQRF